MDKLTTLRAFQTDISLLLQELIDILPEEGDLIALRLIITNISTSELIKDFSEYVVPWEKEIKSKNEKFFLKNDNIFGSISNGRVEHFREIWKSQRLADHNRETIWNFFEVLVKLAKHYRNLNGIVNK